eukprot:scaffold107518_cov20-Tisochrysis_lutea.AAC.1
MCSLAACDAQSSLAFVRTVCCSVRSLDNAQLVCSSHWGACGLNFTREGPGHCGEHIMGRKMLCMRSLM